MSNIGKQPISLPDSVKISISGNLVEVKGQLGELTLNYDSRIDTVSYTHLPLPTNREV